MTPLLGQTRTIFRPRHALITGDGHVPSVLPEVTGARVIAHITPAMGAHFAQFSITFEKGGRALWSSDANEYVFFVQSGSVEATIAGKQHALTAGSFAYLPPGVPGEFSSSDAVITIFEKRYVSLAGKTAPLPLVGHSDQSRASLSWEIPRRFCRSCCPTNLPLISR